LCCVVLCCVVLCCVVLCCVVLCCVVLCCVVLQKDGGVAVLWDTSSCAVPAGTWKYGAAMAFDRFVCRAVCILRVPVCDCQRSSLAQTARNS
jgi:hypothetical protein